MTPATTPATNNGQHRPGPASEEVLDVAEYTTFLFPTSDDSNVAAQAGDLAQSWAWIYPRLDDDIRDRDAVIVHHDTDEGRRQALQLAHRCAQNKAHSV